MNISKAIQHIYPHLNPDCDYEVRDEGEGPFLAEWKSSEPSPTNESLQIAWEQVKDAAPPLSETEKLKKDNELLKQQLEQTNADLAAFMDFVLGGA